MEEFLFLKMQNKKKQQQKNDWKCARIPILREYKSNSSIFREFGF